MEADLFIFQGRVQAFFETALPRIMQKIRAIPSALTRNRHTLVLQSNVRTIQECVYLVGVTAGVPGRDADIRGLMRDVYEFMRVILEFERSSLL